MKTRRSLGFTLIEIMITVLIVGVLAAIALTSYQRNVVETRRKAATACLIESAQAFERFYTTNLTYVDAPLTGVQCRNDLAAFYTFTAEDVAQRAFRLVATAQGVQASRDSACATLALNQAGQRFVGTTAGGGACW